MGNHLGRLGDCIYVLGVPLGVLHLALHEIRDAITRRHHSPIPAPSWVESHQPKQLHLKTTIIARLSILILSKSYPTKVTSRHVGFWLVCFVLPKKQLESWILTFNILAQILVRLPLLR
jgi:hypothetical protein